MQTKTIRQSVALKASPQEVYEAFMDSRQHARFTGAPAKISQVFREFRWNSHSE